MNQVGGSIEGSPDIVGISWEILKDQGFCRNFYFNNEFSMGYLQIYTGKQDLKHPLVIFNIAKWNIWMKPWSMKHS